MIVSRLLRLWRWKLGKLEFAHEISYFNARNSLIQGRDSPMMGTNCKQPLIQSMVSFL